MPLRRVIVTRPASLIADFRAELAQYRIEVLPAPMLSVKPVAKMATIASDVQAILLTSGNGVQGAVRLGISRNLRVLTVGYATAQLAMKAGFVTVTSALGDSASLINLAIKVCKPKNGPLIWISGESVSTDLVAPLSAHGFLVYRHIAYFTIMSTNIPVRVEKALRAGLVDGILFFSPRSAKAFVILVGKRSLEVACSTVSAYCLSDSIAQVISKLKWHAVYVCKMPTKAALIQTMIVS
ncbi:uroporphyrinogen-III synthase HemD family protein [Candidatus Endolissoclinum faulkneri L2]|uniref:Uroporphyrinogen-III synthase n=1 Tax=Candidatus Endolissoclinum faulkneri L2 TaxID=1193729 RepID=K7YNM0_9PROT|nr:uroporphyrinogen-III synthase [Candidatus Endolissoclinum faulkneri]AFX99132.1 uroporphyrinogen-III synthase HemD family protein [Candidatus Endolissoclinum faulkneri L2]